MRCFSRTVWCCLAALPHGILAQTATLQANSGGSPNTVGLLTPKQLIEVQEAGALSLSPDGHWLLFRTSRRSVAANAIEPTREQWLTATDPGSVPIALPTTMQALHWDWASDSHYLISQTSDTAGIHRVLVSIPRLAMTILPVVRMPQGAEQVKFNRIGNMVFYAVRRRSQEASPLVDVVSPESAMTALEADSTYDPVVTPSIGLPSRPSPSHATDPRYDFFVAGVNSSGVLTAPHAFTVPQLGEITIGRALWSPDGRSIIASAYVGHELPKRDPFGPNLYQDTDSSRRTVANDRLYLADPHSGVMIPVTPGYSFVSDMLWSHNSNRLAFSTFDYPPDSQLTLRGQIARVFVANLAQNASANHHDPHQILRGELFDLIGWSQKDDEVVVQQSTRGFQRHVILQQNIRLGSPSHWFDHELRDYPRVVMSGDGRTFAAVGERPGELPQIFVAHVHDPRPVLLVSTAWLNPNLADGELADYDTLSWRAPDGMILHGHVLLPAEARAAGRGSASGSRYPLIVCRKGGPSPSEPRWDGDCPFAPVVLFATRGYIVFLPNVRSTDLRLLNAERRGSLAPTAADLLSGIDALTQRYAIDTTRMGIIGFSYGGMFASYMITQTNRFRAAYIQEGIIDGTLGGIRWTAYPAKAALGAALGMVGRTGDPWSPGDMEMLHDNDVILLSNRVMTPNIVETGVPPLSSIAIFTQYWYSSMLFHHVPVEWWVIPRSGHGWEEPKLILDSYERAEHWFDYWLCDAPLPDTAKQSRYDAWIHSQAAAGDPRWTDATQRHSVCSRH